MEPDTAIDGGRTDGRLTTSYERVVAGIVQQAASDYARAFCCFMSDDARLKSAAVDRNH